MRGSIQPLPHSLSATGINCFDPVPVGSVSLYLMAINSLEVMTSSLPTGIAGQSRHHSSPGEVRVEPKARQRSEIPFLRSVYVRRDRFEIPNAKTVRRLVPLGFDPRFASATCPPPEVPLTTRWSAISRPVPWVIGSQARFRSQHEVCRSYADSHALAISIPHPRYLGIQCLKSIPNRRWPNR